MAAQLFIRVVFYTLAVAFFSCNGQLKTNLPANNLHNQKENPSGKPKLVKTHSTGPGIVNCSLQDKNGNLWFGTTADGLYRFDGNQFVNYTEKDGLTNNHISTILEDKSGNIWIGTNAGLCRYDGKTFTRFTLSSHFNTLPKAPGTLGNTPPSKDAVWSILQDKTGKLWFGTYDDGVYCYDGKLFTRFLSGSGINNLPSVKLKAVNSILEDDQGNIWFATWFEGLCRFDGKTITSYKPNNEVWYSSLLKDKSGNIWIGRRSSGVCKYDGKNFTNVPQNGTFDSCGVRPLIQDSKGNIWFGTMHSSLARRDAAGGQGLWRYDGKTFKNYSLETDLENNSVWSAVEDKTGNIWMGTTNTELYCFNGETFRDFAD